MNNILSSTKGCSGCAACINICPKKAISYKKNKLGFFEATIDKNKCINCGLCKKVCSKFSCEGKNIETGKLISAFSKDEKTRYETTSGGIAYEIAKIGIQKKYIVVGTEYDLKQNCANTTIITKEDELFKLKGSKYLQTKADSAIKQIIEICKKDKNAKFIIFGTPCQIYGYKKTLQFHNFKNEVIYIDLFCHGVPSYNVWEAFLNEFYQNHPKEKILNVNFRSKKNKWHNFTLEIKTNKQTYFFKSEQNTFYKIFFDNIYLNNSCHNCELRKKISSADMRLGDYWGKKYAANLKGISAVTILTEKGQQMMQEINENINITHNEDMNDFLKYQSTYNYQKIYEDTELENITSTTNLNQTIKKYRKRFTIKYRIKELLKTILSYLPISIKNLLRTIK